MGCQTSSTSMGYQSSEPQVREVFAKTLLQAPRGANVAKLEQPVLKVVQLGDASEYLRLDAASAACDGPKCDIRTRVLTGFVFEGDTPKEGCPGLEFKEEHEELDAASSATNAPRWKAKHDLRTRVSTGFAFEHNGADTGLRFKEQHEELDAASASVDDWNVKGDVRTRVLTGFAFEQNAANTGASVDDWNAEDEAVELQCCLFGVEQASCRAIAYGCDEVFEVISSNSEDSLRTCCPACGCDYAPVAKNCRKCGQARPWMPWARNLKAKWPPAPHSGNRAIPLHDAMPKEL